MKIFCFLMLILSVLPSLAFAQTTGNRSVSITLPSVSLLDVEPTGSLDVQFANPNDAGFALAPIINTTKWINYSSAITSGGLSKYISAYINTNAPGITITIQAANASGIGVGNRGISTGPQVLSSNNSTIITNIGGAATGNGTNNGHQLTLTITPTNYSVLTAQTVPIVITYTLTE